MNEDPWGLGTPAALTGDLPPLPPRLAELAELEARGESRRLEPNEGWVFPSVAELPEVQALAAGGWHVAPGDPLSFGLPAVWPTEHRCWVSNRMPRMCLASRRGQRWLEPRSDWEEPGEEEAEEAEAARECGLPAPPSGRLWLLRSPWPTVGLKVVLAMVGRRSVERGLDEGVCGRTEAAREVLTWSEDRVWSWWQGPAAEAAHAWRRLGRAGDDVAGLVVRGLSPTLTARLTDPVTDGGAGLSEEHAVAWARAVGEFGEEGVEAILGWRRLGLPADPPEDDHVVLATMTPAEVSEWFIAGFTFDELGLWRRADLAVAVAWRERGFTPTQARALLAADWTLTPDEAADFDEVGIDARARLAWVETGFTAAQARAWNDLDVLPQEARVWRSLGKAPEDARRHRETGGDPLPADTNVPWVSYGNGRTHRHYMVADPPETRGRQAAEARERRPGRISGAEPVVEQLDDRPGTF
ncbi:MAG: hypothetical protein ACRDPJ_06990 [Nocardioidaceae bacterium]